MKARDVGGQQSGDSSSDEFEVISNDAGAEDARSEIASSVDFGESGDESLPQEFSKEFMEVMKSMDKSGKLNSAHSSQEMHDEAKNFRSEIASSIDNGESESLPQDGEHSIEFLQWVKSLTTSSEDKSGKLNSVCSTQESDTGDDEVTWLSKSQMSQQLYKTSSPVASASIPQELSFENKIDAVYKNAEEREEKGKKAYEKMEMPLTRLQQQQLTARIRELEEELAAKKQSKTSEPLLCSPAVSELLEQQLEARIRDLEEKNRIARNELEKKLEQQRQQQLTARIRELEEELAAEKQSKASALLLGPPDVSDQEVRQIVEALKIALKWSKQTAQFPIAQAEPETSKSKTTVDLQLREIVNRLKATNCPEERKNVYADLKKTPHLFAAFLNMNKLNNKVPIAQAELPTTSKAVQKPSLEEEVTDQTKATRRLIAKDFLYTIPIATPKFETSKTVFKPSLEEYVEDLRVQQDDLTSERDRIIKHIWKMNENSPISRLDKKQPNEQRQEQLMGRTRELEQFPIEQAVLPPAPKTVRKPSLEEEVADRMETALRCKDVDLADQAQIMQLIQEESRWVERAAKEQIPLRRIQQEWETIQRDGWPASFGGSPSETDMFCWHIIFVGPAGTPYEDDIFTLSCVFPTDYPDSPPKVCFTTPIQHPNVDREGNVGLEILQSKWTSDINVVKVLQSIYAFIVEPDLDNAVNQDIAEVYKINRDLYFANAIEWKQYCNRFK
ncbi:ubiquitin-conjugating enzyme domain-containing protein [Ditylenchus destructor]|nr:ubiquitin-conjugating enzyme domain-containing protein [Ditylenchus destructor]